MTETSVFSKTHYRLLAVGILVALIGALVLAPLSADAAPKPKTGSGLLTVPITGTAVDPLTGETFTAFEGTFTVKQFQSRQGVLTVVGTLSGTVFNAAGETIGTVTKLIRLPVVVNQATCEILELTLGPLDLDLLGLVVHLDQVHLTIDAQAGPGNLLGNLLCAIAGLFDQGLPLDSLLNSLVDLLKDLGLA